MLPLLTTNPDCGLLRMTEDSMMEPRNKGTQLVTGDSIRVVCKKKARKAQGGSDGLDPILFLFPFPGFKSG